LHAVASAAAAVAAVDEGDEVLHTRILGSELLQSGCYWGDAGHDTSKARSGPEVGSVRGNTGCCRQSIEL